MLKPSVMILMATFDGKRFIAEQLESLAAQDHGDWELLIADDGSSDQTRSRIAEFMQKPSLCRYNWALIDGPRKGAAANFMFLLAQAHQRIAEGRSNAQFIALADQDDVWLPHKLSLALRAMSAQPQKPTLWCSSVRYWSEQSLQRTTQQSLTPRYPLSFSNALVQNMVRGNTVVINRQALDLIARTANEQSVVMHDWWIYLLMSACGACIIYSDEPTVLYRQHDANVVGAGASWSARLKRFLFMLEGGFMPWNRCHLARLKQLVDCHGSILAPGVAQKILCFEQMLQARSPINRLKWLIQGEFYRQTMAENLSLRLALILGKF